MKHLTYKDLLNALNELNQTELEQNVSIYFESLDEYYTLSHTDTVTETEVLDAGHKILVVSE